MLSRKDMEGLRKGHDRLLPDDLPAAERRTPTPPVAAALAAAFDNPAQLTPGLVSRLQHAAGNGAVQRLLASRPRAGQPVARRLPAPGRTAAAGSALGQGRPTVQRGCGGKQPSAATKAKNIIKNAHMKAEWEKRALNIIKNPDILQQGAFGICGIVSILRHVVVNDPEKFAELTVSAVADTTNTSKRMPAFNTRAHPKQKTDHAELEYLVAHWFVRQGKTTSPGYKKQKAFSDKFQGHFGVVDWRKEGHFALTTGGVQELLDKVTANRGSTRIRVTNLLNDYQTARASAGAKGAVLASVTDVDFYQKRGARITVPAPASPVKYGHWVMLEDVQDTGADLAIRLWTWGGKYAATLGKTVANTYIHSLIAATGKP